MTPDENQRHGLFLRASTAHEPAIQAFLRRLDSSRADADDVMQEVSVLLWQKFGAFREGTDFKAPRRLATGFSRTVSPRSIAA